MRCEELDRVAAAYILGALPENEIAEIDAHLVGCPNHSIALGEFLQPSEDLLQATPQLEPPAGLRDQIMRAARGAPVSLPTREAREERSGWRAPKLRLRLLPALLAVALAGLLGWNLSLQMSRGSDAFVRYMGDRESVHGQIYLVEDVGVITLEGLAPTPEGQSYQAWSATEGTWVSLGLLDVSDTGQGFLLLSRHVSEEERILVTIEPATGSSRPSDAVVLRSER